MTIETADRQRRVRRLTGLLVGGAAVAATAVAVPALALSHGTDIADGATTSTTTTVAPVEATSAAAPVATPEQQVSAMLASASPEELAAFRLYTATPEEQAAFIAFVSPPPPPAAPKPAKKATQGGSASGQSAGGGGAPANGFLACVRNRESHGNYSVHSPGGTYRGAYQFSQSTWNNTASHAGRGDLVGQDPASVSPADQDAMAASLYAWQGRSPWAGPGC